MLREAVDGLVELHLLHKGTAVVYGKNAVIYFGLRLLVVMREDLRHKSPSLLAVGRDSVLVEVHEVALCELLNCFCVFNVTVEQVRARELDLRFPAVVALPASLINSMATSTTRQ